MISNTNHGFCDLNIVLSENVKTTVIHAFKLGYDTVAINRELDDFPTSSEKKSRANDVKIPIPPKINLTPEELKKNGIRKTPKILTRLTIPYSGESSAMLHKHKNVMKTYDVIAFKVSDGAALKSICQSNLEIDLICFDISTFCFHGLRKLIGLAIANDIYFEITYGPCILNSSRRMKTIQYSHELHNFTKSRNIILSSGSAHREHLRNPYDVAHLGLILGFIPAGAKRAVSATPSDVLHCSALRRSGVSKCSALVESTEERKYDSLKRLEEMMEIN